MLVIRHSGRLQYISSDGFCERKCLRSTLMRTAGQVVFVGDTYLHLLRFTFILGRYELEAFLQKSGTFSLQICIKQVWRVYGRH